VARNGEPSVEEILESIKNVMERDNRAAAISLSPRAAPEPQSQPQSQGRDSEEVLDLSEMELSEAVEMDEDHTETGDGADGEDRPLIAEEVRGAMQENLAALAMLAQPGARPQIVRSGETSLEGLTRELLRPMLAEWLDKNLPGMVEKMVQAEIARIAGKRS
jgi:cell pole-organizing protein PopZ